MTKRKPLGTLTNTASAPVGGVPSTVLRFALQAAALELIPQERIKICLRYPKPSQDKILIHRSKTAKKAHFGGLMTCGSIWHCPVCAARISEQRRKELSQATANWTGGMFMITYTASHKISTPLSEILNTIVEGVRSFKSGRKFQTIKNAMAWEGSVKALEPTYGANGWHPHVHELVFTQIPLTMLELDVLEIALKSHWLDVLGRKGWIASTKRGLVISDDKFELARYVAKFGHEPTMSLDDYKNRWSLAHEVTKSVVKKGKQGGRTPTQLLMDYMVDDFEAGEAWREYALCFKGRKQLTWSNGMRDLLKLGQEQGDAEIVDETPENSYVYAQFTLGQWKLILNHDARGDILNKAGYMEQEEFAFWINELFEGWTVKA